MTTEDFPPPRRSVPWHAIGGGGAAVVVTVLVVVLSFGYSGSSHFSRKTPQDTADLIAYSLTKNDVKMYRSALCRRRDSSADEMPKPTNPVSVLAFSEPGGIYGEPGVTGEAVTLRTVDAQRLAVDYSLFLKKEKSSTSWCLSVMLVCPLIDDPPEGTMTPCSIRPGYEPFNTP